MTNIKCSRIKCEFYYKEKNLKPCEKCKEEDKKYLASAQPILERFFTNVKL